MYPESVSPDYLRYQCWEALQVLLGVLGGTGRGLEITRRGAGRGLEGSGRHVGATRKDLGGLGGNCEGGSVGMGYWEVTGW